MSNQETDPCECVRREFAATVRSMFSARKQYGKAISECEFQPCC